MLAFRASRAFSTMRPLGLPRYSTVSQGLRSLTLAQPVSERRPVHEYRPQLGIHHFSTTPSAHASQRSFAVANLRKALGPSYADKTLPTDLLLSTLRDMRIERTINNHPEKFSLSYKQESNNYRDGHRAIALLAADKHKKTLSVGEIEEVLSDENGLVWSAIRELLETGKIARMEKLSDEKKLAVLFQRVHGIGASARQKLIDAGYRTLDELKTIPEKNKLLSKAMRIGLTHLEDMEAMIPHAEVTFFKGLIEAALTKADPELKFEIMGSYRRGEAMSSDIDLVVWHDSYEHLNHRVPHELMDKLSKALYDAKLLSGDMVFAHGDKKISALTRLPDDPEARYRQIDIRISPSKSMPYMLLGNTGDDELMKILRRQANYKGWVLNEYQMGEKRTEDKSSTWAVDGTEHIVTTEKEIFDLLDVPYLERSYRDYVKILPRRLL